MNSSSSVESKIIGSRSNDIDEILVRSQRLVAMHQQSQGSGYHSSSSDNRNVINKGISELSDYTKQLQAQSTSDHHNTEAFRLLSQKNFDAKKLYEDLSAINVEMMDNDSSSVRLEGTDIEGYLAHHHDMIILTTIEDVRRGAEDHMHEMQRRWAAAEWSTARAKFMDDVGHKSYSWEGSSAIVPTTPRDKRLMTPQASDSHSILLSPSTRRSFTGQSSVTAMPTPFRTPLSELMQAQSSIIRRLNLQSHSTNSSTAAAAAAVVKPYSLLNDCIKVPNAVTAVNAVVSDGLFKSDLVAYTSHLELMSFAVGERSVAADISSRYNTPLAAGYFSPISVDTGDVFNAVVDGRRSLLTRGSMQFFEQQIQDVWMLTLDDALSAGTWTVLPRSEGTNRQQRLKSYVAYLSHMNQLPPGCRELCVVSSSTTQPSASGGGFTSGYGLHGGGKPVGSAVSLWAYLYHCVRSGQMDLAQTELELWVSREYDNGQSSVLSVLQLMMLLKTKTTNTAAATAANGGGGGGGASVSRQQRAAVSSEPLLRDNEVRLLHESILQCRSFYERELRSEEDQSMQDPYRCMLFNLFGLADKDGLAGSSIPGFSLEDFMWSNLWFVDNVRLLKPSLTNLSDSLIASERSLFGLVMEYGGSDYFDADRSNPFRYAMVLSCCQRYGDAIAHLWQCNKAIPAVHLIVVALHYGLILPHLPLHMNPSLPMVMGGKTYFNLNQQEPTPADVLQLFVKSSLLNKHPAIAVDYLVSLDSNWLVPATIESDAKDISKVKCQSIVTSVFEGFLMQLSRDQLVEVVGTPLPTAMQGNSNKTARTSGGRLDDYFSAHQVDMLLNSCAFNLLTYHKDVESAIYFYELSGQLTEAMEQLCIQLTNVFMPPQQHSTSADASSTQLYQDTRDKWRAISKQFIIEFLQTSSSSSSSSVDQSNAASSGYLALRDSLLVIMSLMEFVDDVVHSSADVDYTQALAVLDKHNILPTNEQQIDHFSSLNNPYLRRIMDDALVVAMDCTLAAFRQTKADRMRDSMNPAVSHALKQRATALRMFAYKIKSRLNRLETPSVLVNMEAVLIN